MAKRDLKIGDVVLLKSGSPLMTIQTLNRGTKGDMAECVWFVREEPKTDLFVPATLEIHEDQ